MSYVTQDRHGAATTHYASQKSREVVGTGTTWWPDFGPSQRDHSYQEKYAPHHHIFEKVVKPYTVGKPQGPPPLERQPAQFRNPQPGRHAMLMQDQPSHERRLAAKSVTDKQGALRMLEVRQRQVDSWMGEPPVRMAAAASSSQGRALRSSSEPSLSSGAAAEASRDVYEKLGFLVGKSKGTIADGYNGAKARRHNALSFNALMFSGKVVDGRGRPSRSSKPSKQWRLCPESSFVFDARTSLPVPRGGWNSQPPTSWPEPPAAGRREWAAPVTFDARPKRDLQALPEWERSPSAHDRKVTAGSAGATVRKHPYGEVREPGQERQGLGAQALQTTASFSSFGQPSPPGAASNSMASNSALQGVASGD